jgi:hypothetical protein
MCKNLILTISVVIFCLKINAQTEFKWDFSKPVNLAYHVETMVDIEFKSSPDDTIDNRLPDTVLSKLIIESKSNSFADIKWHHGLEMNSDNVQTLKDYGENGRFKTIPNETSPLMFVFGVPTKELRIGEKDSVPMSFPANFKNNSLTLNGYNILTYERNETFKNVECAVLTGKINISKVSITKDVDYKFKGWVVGKATYYYDIKNHRFLHAEVEYESYLQYIDTNFYKEINSREKNKLDFLEIVRD